MIETIMIEGRIRRIIGKQRHHDGVLVEVVVGFRVRQSSSAKSPGSGWRAVPGQARQWTKSEPKTDEIVIKQDAIMVGEDWPTGAKELGFSPDDYAEIIKPMLAVAVEASGAIGLRQVPELQLSTCERAIKDAGLALPTAGEFAEMTDTLWRDAYQQKPRTNTAPPSITGRQRRRQLQQEASSISAPESPAPESPAPESPAPESPAPSPDEAEPVVAGTDGG